MDVAVVGGGVIGLLSAFRLSQRGHRVTVVERSEPGGEASWAAAGILGELGLKACAEGRALSPPEAIAYALGETELD